MSAHLGIQRSLPGLLSPATGRRWLALAAIAATVLAGSLARAQEDDEPAPGEAPAPETPAPATPPAQDAPGGVTPPAEVPPAEAPPAEAPPAEAPAGEAPAPAPAPAPPPAPPPVRQQPPPAARPGAAQPARPAGAARPRAGAANGRAPPAGQQPPAGGLGAAAVDEQGEVILPGAEDYKGQPVKIAAGDIELRQFLRFLAEYTALPVIVDSTQKAQLDQFTITITAPIMNADADLVMAILEANRFLVTREILPSGKEILRVDSVQTPAPPTDEPKPNPIVEIGGSGEARVVEDITSGEKLGLNPDEIATMVFTLRYAQPTDAITALNNLVAGAKPATAKSKAFSIVDVKNSQMVIVTAKFGLLNYLKKLLSIIDVPIKEPERILEIIEVENADAEELTALIEQFISGRTGAGGFGRRGVGLARPGVPAAAAPGQPQPGAAAVGGRTGEPETRLIPDYRTQKIIVESYDERQLEDVHLLVRELDVRFDYRRLKTHIYQVRYLKADEVATDIQVLIGGSGTGLSGRAGLGGRAGGVGGRGGAAGRTRGVARVGQQRGQAAGPIGQPLPGAPGAAGGAGQPGTIPALIVPHIQTNSLLIQAEPEEYAEILNILGEIDIKRRQVFLEAALVQVSAGSTLNYTIELLAGEPHDEATRALFETSFGLTGVDTENFNRVIPDISDPAAVPPGALLAIMNRGKFPAIVRFFKTNTDTEVLATPFILADDNMTNVIEILETRFVQLTNTVNTVTTTSQEAEDAGITLEITPTISSKNAVFLELALTVSAFQQGGTAQVLPPKTENNVTSAVTIPDGEIFVIGGLTREDRSKSVSKVPIIGDIPLIGKLFRSEGISKSASNLYVFLRAHVLTHPDFDDGKELTRQGDKQMREFAHDIEPFHFRTPDVAFPEEAPPDPDRAMRIPLGPEGVNSDERSGRRRRRFADEQSLYDTDRESPYRETGAAPPSPTRPVPREALPPEPPVSRETPAVRPEEPEPAPEAVQGGEAPKVAEEPTRYRILEERGVEVDPDRKSWLFPLRPRR